VSRCRRKLLKTLGEPDAVRVFGGWSLVLLEVYPRSGPTATAQAQRATAKAHSHSHSHGRPVARGHQQAMMWQGQNNHGGARHAAARRHKPFRRETDSASGFRTTCHESAAIRGAFLPLLRKCGKGAPAAATEDWVSPAHIDRCRHDVIKGVYRPLLLLPPRPTFRLCRPETPHIHPRGSQLAAQTGRSPKRFF
jgi:hypothetical protein